MVLMPVRFRDLADNDRNILWRMFFYLVQELGLAYPAATPYLQCLEETVALRFVEVQPVLEGGQHLCTAIKTPGFQTVLFILYSAGFFIYDIRPDM